MSYLLDHEGLRLQGRLHKAREWRWDKQQHSQQPSQQNSANNSSSSSDSVSKLYFDNSSGLRVNTTALLAAEIRKSNPGLKLTVVPTWGVNFLAYANSTGLATYSVIIDPADPLTVPLTSRVYIPPFHRSGDGDGSLADELHFGKFAYSYQGQDYILYSADGRDPPFILQNQYLLHGDSIEAQAKADKMITTIGKWGNTLHDEIWVFDGGYWQKSAELFRSISKSRWEDVILDESEKTALRGDVNRFFNGQARYEKYRIAWKRGVIYFGPPGNGKTISIKALANELYSREDPIPALYVKSLTSFMGPEYSVKSIFDRARAEAPCLLVFEDLDSLITDQVRSYFLNEVDGLNSNNGVYMIGSTNYIDRLDPGLSNRPSRFDRKFNFAKPTEAERTQYCEYWRHKLHRNSSKKAVLKNDDTEEQNEHEALATMILSMTCSDQKGDAAVAAERTEQEDEEEDDDFEDLVHVPSDIKKIVDKTKEKDDGLEFPKALSPQIAKITDKFSFAYLQEAFVATLLAIAAMQDDSVEDEEGDVVSSDGEDDGVIVEKSGNGNDKRGGGEDDGDEFEHLLFWRVIQKQVAVLRKQID